MCDLCLYREFDKSWECEENTDPSGFSLIHNGGCMPRDFIQDFFGAGDNDIDANVHSITLNCKGIHFRYYAITILIFQNITL